MKTRFNKIFILFFALSLAIAGCGDDDDERAIVNPNNPGNGTDNVFRGLPFNGITVGLPSGAKLRFDQGGEAREPIGTQFSMTIAPNNQFVMVHAIEFVPSFWTYPTHPGPLDFFAVSRNEYSEGTSANPFGGPDTIWGPWQAQRFAVGGRGVVHDINGQYVFQGEVILYTMQSSTDFSFETGSFGLRVSFGGAQPPQRIGVIR